MKNKIKAMLFAGALLLATVAAGSVTAKAETPAIKYSGTDGGVEWSIDENGHLLLTGNGDYRDVTWTDTAYCKEIKTATVKVKNMTSAGGMFFNCTNLKRIDFSEFDTSQITNMSGMFCMCESLVSLDLSNFKTQNVTAMSAMFLGCTSLYKLDLSSFDTSKVTNMSGMFVYCSKIKRLNLSSFNTSNVTDMSGMFSECENLVALDVKHFDTKKVKSMSSMFAYCSRLTELDLSNWDLSALSSASGMFVVTKFARITLPNLPIDIDLPDMYYDGKYNLTNVAKAGQGKMTYLLAAYGDSYCHKNGHTYSLPNFTWADDYSSATVYFECTRKDCKFDVDDKHVQMDATVTKTVVNPTTEKEGATNYTATVVLKGKTYTDVKSIAIPKLPAQTPTAKPVGTSFKTSTTLYRVTKAGKTPELAYMGPKNKKVKKVTIPATVKINGITYKVTSVAAGALKNYKNLTKVTVGKNVTKIGKNAFYGCKKLKTIVIKSKKLKTVGKNAIKGINKKAKIDVPNSKKKAYKKLFKTKTGYKKTMKIK